MIQSNQKTSLFIPSQLPEYLLDTSVYGNNFVSFLQAYYEWMELANTTNSQITIADTSGTQGALYASKSLWDYTDIDNTIEGFQNYFINDFLQYFPAESLISPVTAVKTARQLYQSKGTPASYQFLFRVLFNSDFDYFYTKDAVLSASSGTWYIPKSIKLASTDLNFLLCTNLRVFGLTSKSFATIENVIVAQNKIEIFISDIERLFQSGEQVTILDSYNQPVYFLNGNIVSANTVGAETLVATIVGQISSVNIDPNNRGLGYNVADPVIVYGGLNSNIAHPIGAVAEVAEVTTGSIQGITVVSGGYGYTISPIPAVTQLYPGNGFSSIYISGQETSLANATIFSVTSNNTVTIKLPIDSIAKANGYQIGQTYSFLSANTSANANASLANSLTFTTFDTNPIGSILLNNGGGGMSSPPSVTALSSYVSNDTTNNIIGSVTALGILAPIQIANTGTGYRSNDTIAFSGGYGYGANARLTVDGNGNVTNVMYYATEGLPQGGLGYVGGILPKITINTSTGHGANLYTPSILGSGASFSLSLNRIGSITTINLIDGGEDYISSPGVSLKVQDIVVSNVGATQPPTLGQVIYQGANINVATYMATVNSISLLQQNYDPTQSLYNLRVFNYSSQPNPAKPLLIANSGGVSITMANVAYTTSTYIPSPYNQYGVRNYGDGNADATAKYLNGLVIGQGQYLDSSGQLSSYDVLQSSDYNNFTYQITVEKAISDYRNTLLNLLHPSGIKLIGRFALKSNSTALFTLANELNSQKYLSDIIGTNNPTGTINVSDNKYVVSANMYYSGASYNIGDVLTVVGGTSVYPAQIIVTGNTGIDSSISSYAISNVGNYSTFPTNPVSFTGGHGEFAELWLWPAYVQNSSNTITFTNLPAGNTLTEYLSNANTFSMTTSNNLTITSTIASINNSSNTITFTDSAWSRFPNIAFASGNSSSNVINIASIYTSVYNVYNNGNYTNNQYPIIDVIQTGDSLSQFAYHIGVVDWVDYANSLVYLKANSNYTFSSNVAVKKAPLANANQILVSGVVGQDFEPYISTEDGNSQIITEDGQYILLG